MSKNPPMGTLMYKWEIGLRPNFAVLIEDLRRHRKLLSQDNHAAMAVADEVFADTLRIATQHFYRTQGSFAKAAGMHQSKLSGWMNGHQKPPVKEQLKVYDVVIKDMDHALAETAELDGVKPQPQTLTEKFSASRNLHLVALGQGINEILRQEQGISEQDFHMAVTTAQSLLYTDHSPKELAKAFDTSTSNYNSWTKGKNAPPTDEQRRQVLSGISIDLELKLLGA